MPKVKINSQRRRRSKEPGQHTGRQETLEKVCQQYFRHLSRFGSVLYSMVWCALGLLCSFPGASALSVRRFTIEKEMNGRQKKLNHLQQLGRLWLMDPWNSGSVRRRAAIGGIGGVALGIFPLGDGGAVCAIFAHRALSCGLSPGICRIFFFTVFCLILFHFIFRFHFLSFCSFFCIVFRFSICCGKLLSIMTQKCCWGDILMAAWVFDR